MKRKLSIPKALAFVVLGVAASACGDSKPSPEPCFCFSVDSDAGPRMVDDGGGTVTAACGGPNDPKWQDPAWQCEVA